MVNILLEGEIPELNIQYKVRMPHGQTVENNIGELYQMVGQFKTHKQVETSTVMVL